MSDAAGNAVPTTMAEAICARIDSLSDTLLAVSHSIHANPELAFKEHHAAATLCDTLDAQDLPARADEPRLGGVEAGPGRGLPCIEDQHQKGTGHELKRPVQNLGRGIRLPA